MSTMTSAKSGANGRKVDQPPGCGDFVTVRLDGQLFGIPVLQVQDVLRKPVLTRVPLAPMGIVGLLNLRGRIVTALCVRSRLGLAPPDGEHQLGVVVEHGGNLYCLLVDAVGDVLTLGPDSHERNPPTLDACWRSVVDGVHRLERELMLILDKALLLSQLDGADAA